MRTLTAENFRDLLDKPIPPCISLYMPAMKGTPGAVENRPRFEALLSKAQTELERSFNEAQAAQLLQPFRDFASVDDNWRSTDEGLAVFGSADVFRVYHLPKPVKEEIQVADSFHVKHLLRAFQFSGRYEVLCLTQGEVSAYSGSQDRLEPLKLPNVPKNINQALGREVQENHVTDDNKVRPMMPWENIARHIGGGDELERFMRIVDRCFWEFHSRDAGWPVILAAPQKHQPLFREITKNPNIVSDGIVLNPGGLPMDRLAREAWKIVEPLYRAQVQKVLDEFDRARATNSGSEKIEQVAEAAAMARVGILLVDSDKHIGGRVDPTGRIEFGDLSRPEFDDLLDDLAEQVVKKGGQVLVMPTHQMPTDTGVAAIYRY